MKQERVPIRDYQMIKINQEGSSLRKLNKIRACIKWRSFRKEILRYIVSMLFFQQEQYPQKESDCNNLLFVVSLYTRALCPVFKAFLQSKIKLISNQ